MDSSLVACNFCKKTDQEVDAIGVAESAAICNECIVLYSDALEAGRRFTLSEREGKSLWTALQKLAQLECEDELGAILKNNAGQLEYGDVANLVAKLREWGTDQVEADLARGTEFSVWRMKNGFVRIAARIKSYQPEDFNLTGEEARKRYVEWILWTAAGLLPEVHSAVEGFLKRMRETVTS